MTNLLFLHIEEKYPQAYCLFAKANAIPIAFLDSQGIYIVNHPEFYKDGINWQMQIFWYDEELSAHDDYVNGTMMYGDNNEFPERFDAEVAGILLGFEILERKLNGRKLYPEGIQSADDKWYNFDIIYEKLTDGNRITKSLS